MKLANSSQAIVAVARAVVQTVVESEPLGAPGGPMYVAFTAHDITLEAFQNLMDGLCRAELLRRDGDCYRATSRGRLFAASVKGTEV